MGGSFWGQPTARLTPSTRKNNLPRMLRRRSSNVYCPHNGVLCREEDLTLSAVCSTCAQAHLAHHQAQAQAHPAQNDLPNPTSTNISTSLSNKDLVDSSSSSSSMKLKQKRVVFVVPPLTEAEHRSVVAEE